MRASRRTALFLIGTRPEAIKLASVVLAAKRSGSLRPLVCVSGQHRHMVNPMLAHFRVKPDLYLGSSKHLGDLSKLVAHTSRGLGEILGKRRPDWLVVQGDTTTAMVGAMCGYYLGVPVAHVEAGLRSGNMNHPFPEEFNRRVVSLASTLHFAPTKLARENLLREGIRGDRVRVVGNTCIDALVWTLRERPSPPLFRKGCRGILVTVHRRENIKHGVKAICGAIRQLCRGVHDLHVLLPMHPNPLVRRVIRGELEGCRAVSLVEPLGYAAFCQAMKDAFLIITDSGGVQEEALALGTPTLVTRIVTERPEVLRWGTVRLVGSQQRRIVAEARGLLKSQATGSRAAQPHFPFGRGDASEKIIRILNAV